MTVPTAPGALALQADELGIALTWQDRSDNEAGFRVYRRAWDQPVAAVYETAANTVGWVDKGVEPGVHYTYYVVAFNAAGESLPSNEEIGVISAE